MYSGAYQGISFDSLCPILSSYKINYKTLEDIWNNQISRKKPVSIQQINGSDVEIINLEKANLKALGYHNGMGSWFPIKSISRSKYTGEMITLSQKYGSIRISPDHLIYDQSQAFRKVHDNPWLLNVRKLNYKSKRHNDLYKLYVAGKYEFDDFGLWLPEIGVIGKLSRLLDKSQLKAYLSFIGAFIAEGSTSYNKNNKNYYIYINEQDIHWLEEVQSNLNCFYQGKSWMTKTKKANYCDVHQLCIKSRVLYNHLRELCGLGSYHKRIPDAVLQLDKEEIKEMILKMIDGDGCYDKQTGHFRYTTASYILACQLSFIFTLLGYDYTVCLEKSKKYGEYWHFRQCKTYQYDQGIFGRKIKSYDYNNYIYDISVSQVNNFSVGVGNIIIPSFFTSTNS